MIVPATADQASTILGAMRWVATTGGTTPLSDADRATLEAAYRFVFKGAGGLDVDSLPATLPAELGLLIHDPGLAEHAVRSLAVMSLVDGRVDPGKIAVVETYAAALRVREDYLRQLAEAAEGHLQWVAADMMRRNIESIPGLVWNPDDPSGTFLPYGGPGADPDLARRYRALADCPPGTFGRAFWTHYHANGYPFPGEPMGLNERFATPHDSTHVLSGYDTSPHGELLVSTFTAAMHRQEPMAGHILPVIFSWHLGVQLNPVAKSAVGAFDPGAFWQAWDRGSDVAVDTFDPAWDFWSATREPLADLRRRYAIPPLDPAVDATLTLLESPSGNR
jgi:hypothetical protein